MHVYVEMWIHYFVSICMHILYRKVSIGSEVDIFDSGWSFVRWAGHGCWPKGLQPSQMLKKTRAAQMLHRCYFFRLARQLQMIYKWSFEQLCNTRGFHRVYQTCTRICMSYLSAALSDARWHADQCEKSLKAAVVLSICQCFHIFGPMRYVVIHKGLCGDTQRDHGCASIKASCYPLVFRTINVSVWAPSQCLSQGRSQPTDSPTAVASSHVLQTSCERLWMACDLGCRSCNPESKLWYIYIYMWLSQLAILIQIISVVNILNWSNVIPRVQWDHRNQAPGAMAAERGERVERGERRPEKPGGICRDILGHQICLMISDI